jgi:DNA polymerase I-like protein with 3'-5' exonuclease and polymerase domains
MMLEGVQLHLVETLEDVHACMEWLEGLTCDRIGFDTETTGLSPETDRVRLVQFGDRFHGWAIPIDWWYGLIQEIIHRWQRRGRFVAHNARYDVAMLRNHDIHIPVHLVDDTMILAHIVDPTKSVGLKQQCARHIDAQAAAAQGQLDDVMHSGGYTWATIPIAASGPCAVYWIYAALDPVLAVRLWEHHWPTVDKTAPRAYDIELSVGWIADRMERKGVLIDAEYTAEKRTEFEELHDRLAKRGIDEFGVSLGSAEQIVEVLLRDEVPLWKRTGEGAWSLDKFALEGIRHPLVQLLQEYKRVEKLDSTYLRRFLEYSRHDGRLHPSINTLGFKEQSAGAYGVVTGRMSMSKPNLQQLPRVDESDPLSIVVRNCVVSSPNSTFVMFDFDQIELRIMAHLTQDPGLFEAFAQPGDFFTYMTQTIYNDPTIVKKDPRRSLTKSYVYASNYGSGNDRLARTTHIPLTEIERLAADYRRAYSGVPKFQRDVQNQAAARYKAEGVAYVTSPLTGRRFIASDPKKLYPLVNYCVQGLAAEIMKVKLLELDAAGLGEYLVLAVHDEAIAEIPDNQVSDAIATMNTIMNDDTLLSLPLTSGGATGRRWAEKRDL